MLTVMKRFSVLSFLGGYAAALLALALIAAPVFAGSAVTPEDLRCEYISAPIGVDVAQPRLSWRLAGDGAQSAYRVKVALEDNFTDASIVWDSGWVESADSAQIVYSGKPLDSDTDYFWSVQVKDAAGEVSDAVCSTWTSGLAQEDWTAQWIWDGHAFAATPEDGNNPPDPFFRKSFDLKSAPNRAIFFLASFGYHELYVNGQKVSENVLAPNVSDLGHRVCYVAYDIKDYLRAGKNTVAVWLGSGWSIYANYRRDDRPNAPAFMAQCDIRTDEGSYLLVSDDSWKSAPSEIQLLGVWFFGQYGGEFIDTNKAVPDWNRTEFDDSAWSGVETFTPSVAVSGQFGEQNRCQEWFHAVGIEEKQPGVWRVDMGQNFAGWMKIHFKGKPGSKIEMQFSESPLSDMTFNLRSWCVLDANGEAVFENRFNYSSARWITVTGLKEKPALEDFTGCTVRTGYERASSFECDDDLANWIYNTVLKTYENLSLGGYVVDCPQRERLGYGGDAHATCETGMFNYKLGYFYFNWMQSWRDVQGWNPAWLKEEPLPMPGMEAAAAAGTLPNTAPTYEGGGGPAWGGIVVTLPWFFYQHYGDTRILEENFPMIEKWLAFLNAYVKDGLLYRYGTEWYFLGDWLWPGAPGGPNSDTEDTLCLNNIYRVFNLRTAAKIARTIGREDRAEEWEAIAEAGRKAVNAKYFHPEDNSYFDGRMSIQAAALLAELPDAETRPAVMKRLEEEILINQKGHIGAGITGGAILFRLLRQEGRDDLIWSMLNQTEYPGYGFMRANDATTIWEAWELNRPGHSLLHSSYLYPGAWYIDSALGIRTNPEEPGFRSIRIHPPKFDALSWQWAKGHFDAPTGRVAVDWKKSGGDTLTLAVTLPANTGGEVYVPSAGKDKTEAPQGAVWLRDEDGYSVFSVGPGSFTFVGRQ